MKKAFLVCLSVLVLVAFVPRPAAATVTFDLGIKGGFSLANITELYDGEKFPSTSPITKPVFGGFVAINLNKVLTFQPEVYYLSQGGIWEHDDEGMMQKWREVFNYLHIPLLVKFHLMPEAKVIPIIFAGPAVDFLLSSNAKYWEDGELIYDEAFDHELKSPIFCLDFGGGVEIMMDKLMLILEVRYSLGLTNIIAEASAFGWSYKTKTLMIMAGVGF